MCSYTCVGGCLSNTDVLLQGCRCLTLVLETWVCLFTFVKMLTWRLYYPMIHDSTHSPVLFSRWYHTGCGHGYLNQNQQSHTLQHLGTMSTWSCNKYSVTYAYTGKVLSTGSLSKSIVTGVREVSSAKNQCLIFNPNITYSITCTIKVWKYNKTWTCKTWTCKTIVFLCL